VAIDISRSIALRGASKTRCGFFRIFVTGSRKTPSTSLTRDAGMLRSFGCRVFMAEQSMKTAEACHTEPATWALYDCKARRSERDKRALTGERPRSYALAFPLSRRTHPVKAPSFGSGA
jgi:hypothetical protein